MAKLIFEDSNQSETVVKDEHSPNGVRLTHLYFKVRVWRTRLRRWTYTGEARYIISEFGWYDKRKCDADCPPDYDYDFLFRPREGETESDAGAIRRAIKELDEHVSHYAVPHENMSEHPAYRDVALAPPAKVEA